jgi:hypothetical protein
VVGCSFARTCDVTTVELVINGRQDTCGVTSARSLLTGSLTTWIVVTSRVVNALVFSTQSFQSRVLVEPEEASAAEPNIK